MDLAHLIRMKFGTSMAEPTSSQLDSIARDVEALSRTGRSVELDDFRNIVSAHCPSAGTWFYKGADTSELSTLLALALKQTKGK